jgi:hypothetical protein
MNWMDFTVTEVIEFAENELLEIPGLELLSGCMLDIDRRVAIARRHPRSAFRTPSVRPRRRRRP